MITFYTIPRPFTGQFEHIQQNAIRSWEEIWNPEYAPPEIILCGAKHADLPWALRRPSVRTYPIARNAKGIPLINSAINTAKKLANYDVLAFVNADVIFLYGLFRAVSEIADEFEEFVIVGQRHDLVIEKQIDFGNLGWAEDYVDTGKLHASCGIDYFIYRGNPWGPVPSMAVGRQWYDQWLMHRALANKIPVIDATAAIKALHQEHGGKPWKNDADAQKQRDANKIAARGFAYISNITDSTWVFDYGKLRKREKVYSDSGL